MRFLTHSEKSGIENHEKKGLANSLRILNKLDAHVSSFIYTNFASNELCTIATLQADPGYAVAIVSCFILR